MSNYKFNFNGRNPYSTRVKHFHAVLETLMMMASARRNIWNCVFHFNFKLVTVDWNAIQLNINKTRFLNSGTETINLFKKSVLLKNPFDSMNRTYTSLFEEAKYETPNESLQTEQQGAQLSFRIPYNSHSGIILWNLCIPLHSSILRTLQTSTPAFHLSTWKVLSSEQQELSWI
jgi:hypothetical protein